MINFSNRHSYTYITRHTKRRAPYIYFRYNSCVSSQIQIQIQIQKYEHHISIFAINLMCHHQASHSLLRVSVVSSVTRHTMRDKTSPSNIIFIVITSTIIFIVITTGTTHKVHDKIKTKSKGSKGLGLEVEVSDW